MVQRVNVFVGRLATREAKNRENTKISLLYPNPNPHVVRRQRFLFISSVILLRLCPSYSGKCTSDVFPFTFSELISTHNDFMVELCNLQDTIHGEHQ